uniref:Aminotransferase class V domain-containing protein n=1 Tax=Kalanchoe fedtschenkoi TaxID=63787 RepID=A0A7N0TNJ7_KALFE
MTQKSKTDIKDKLPRGPGPEASRLSSGLCRQYGSFRSLENGLPWTGSAEKRLAWLQSQIIGQGAEFESAFGRRRITYADHTASGRSLQYIEDYIIQHVLPFYGNTHTCDSYVGHHTTSMVHEASHYIKTRLGGGPNDVLLFCGSGSTAAIKKLQEVMGILVSEALKERVLGTMKDEEKWVVFVGPYEHHSNLLSWRHSLAEVVAIGLDENGLLDMEDLRAQLDKYQSASRPLLGSFSACSNVTGLQTDTRAIAKLLHEYGAFACFDCAASGPYEEIDMRSGEVDGYDAVFLSPHKFLGGPGTPGILLMSKALYQLASSHPSTCGGGTVYFVSGYNVNHTLYYDNIEEREDAGTPQIVQKIRAALAFWVKEYVGYDLIGIKERSFVRRALERLVPNKNMKILGTTSQKRLAIISFLIFTTIASLSDMMGSDRKEEMAHTNIRGKPLHGPFCAKLLNDLFGIQARGGCSCAGPYGEILLGADEKYATDLRYALQKEGYIGVKPGWTRIWPTFCSTLQLRLENC